MLEAIVVLLKAPAAMTGINYILTGMLKWTIETYAAKIPNRVVTIGATVLGAISGQVVTGDAFIGAVVGLGSAGLHGLIKPRKKTK